MVSKNFPLLIISLLWPGLPLDGPGHQNGLLMMVDPIYLFRKMLPEAGPDEKTVKYHLSCGNYDMHTFLERYHITQAGS